MITEEAMVETLEGQTIRKAVWDGLTEEYYLFLGDDRLIHIWAMGANDYTGAVFIEEVDPKSLAKRVKELLKLS